MAKIYADKLLVTTCTRTCIASHTEIVSPLISTSILEPYAGHGPKL